MLDDELRIALAMRGGVSLAVWIGGASAEVDALCRGVGPESTSRDDFWLGLAAAAGYGSVIVDVMSGASAGGLNAVIGAAGMAYGFSLDTLRNVWLQLGDLNSMVRTNRSDPDDGLSLLYGDAYFLAKLNEKLQTFATDKYLTGGAPRIDVTLAATLLNPITVERIQGKADTAEQRFTSTFRFRNGSPVHTDFPQDAPGRVGALERLALAGRATSSFPAAFEAAEVAARRPASFVEAAAPPPPRGVDDLIAMLGVFGEATASPQPFCVMDGGVLDNIPIGRAIDAIVDAPADRPTRRVLVYVQPGSAGSTVETSNTVDRSTQAVVTAIVRTRVQEETIAGDLRQLEVHNERVRRSRLSAEAAVRRLLPQQSNTAPPRTSARYIAQRASQEADVISKVLADPIGVLGGDPFPMLDDFDDLDIDRRWRSPIAAMWSREDAAELPIALMRNIEHRLEVVASIPEKVMTVGAGPLRRLTQLLIEACRALHRCAPPTTSPAVEANTVKASLYRVLTVHAELVERQRALACVVLAVRRADHQAENVADWVEAAINAVESLTGDSASLDVDSYLDGGIGANTSLPLAAADQEMRRRLDILLESQVPPLTSTDDLRDQLMKRLVRHATELASAEVDTPTLRRLAKQGDLGVAVLDWLQAKSPASMVDRLADLEQATYDPSTIGELGCGTIDFLRLSGANPTPLAAAFPRLLGSPPELDPWGRIEARLCAPQPVLGDDRKLAGNELMNFSAFLRARWRANDWMWGRLDAVPTLIEILVEPERMRMLAESTSTGDSDTDCEILLDLFFAISCAAGAAVTSPEWKQFLLRTTWRPREAAIRDAIRAVIAAANDHQSVPAADLGDLRAALTSARQWAILAELLPHVHDADVQPADAIGASPAPVAFVEPKELVELANDYWVGVETIGNPGVKQDGVLVTDLVGAAQAMLARTTSGPAAIAGRILVPTVAFLRWIWLEKTTPKVLGAVLLVLGLAGLTVPALCIADGTWPERLAAAAAGPAALLFVIGVVVLLVRSKSVGFLICLVGIFGVFWAAWRSGLAAMAVGVGVVAVVVLVAGAALSVLVRLRPRLPE